jgi:hypothetical protein
MILEEKPLRKGKISKVLGYEGLAEPITCHSDQESSLIGDKKTHSTTGILSQIS